MAGSKFDPQLFFQRADNVAMHVPASELFGLFKRTLDLPPQWAAMVKRKTGDYLVTQTGGEIDGTDVEEVLFVRTTPIEVTLEESDLITRDRFGCSAVLTLRVSLIPERGELRSFSNVVLGSHRVVQASGLAEYLQPALRIALVELAARHDASDLVGAGATDATSTALADAIKAPCFAAGMDIESSPTVRFDSQTLRQVQATQQEAARQRAEHEASHQVQAALERAQAKHLDRLASLLDRVKKMAADTPEVELPELVRTFSERERGELYQALFESEPATSRTKWIAVAAGDEILYFEPDSVDAPVRRIRITGKIGPVRSIQSVYESDGSVTLFLGAATGVYRLGADQMESDLTLVVDGAPSVRGGFNSVALVGDRVFASHSELGIYEWDIHEQSPGRTRFASVTQEAKAVRGIQFDKGDLYCAIDQRVIRWPSDEPDDVRSHTYSGSSTVITALCPTKEGLFAGNGDGEILHWPGEGKGEPVRLHTGPRRAAESLWLLTSHGVRRLVYTDTSLQVIARVLGDSFECRYQAGGQTLRRVEVAPDILVATNDLRDRLICWAPGQPTAPSAIIPVARICSRSIQDVCLVPQV